MWLLFLPTPACPGGGHNPEAERQDMSQIELITRSWTDLNRKVKSGGLWALVTVVISYILNSVLPGSGISATFVVEALQNIINAAGPLIPVIAAYLTREAAQNPTGK